MSTYRSSSFGFGSRKSFPQQTPQHQTANLLGPDYLKDGYFDSGGRPRGEIITTLAFGVARELKQSGLTTHQIRNFYNKAMFLKRRLDSGQSFEDVKWRLQTLHRDAANAVGKKNAPEKFKQFIDRNAQLAAKDAHSFKDGFIQHFQSVVAFLNYLEERK